MVGGTGVVVYSYVKCSNAAGTWCIFSFLSTGGLGVLLLSIRRERQLLITDGPCAV